MTSALGVQVNCYIWPRKQKGKQQKEQVGSRNISDKIHCHSKLLHNIARRCSLKIWQRKCKVSNELYNTCNNIHFSLACSFDFNSWNAINRPLWKTVMFLSASNNVKHLAMYGLKSGSTARSWDPFPSCGLMHILLTGTSLSSVQNFICNLL